MLSYRKYVKAVKDMMLSFKGVNYDFYKGEVQEVEFVNARHYKNILSTTDLVPSSKAEMKLSRIPIIYPPALSELTSIPEVEVISARSIVEPKKEDVDSTLDTETAVAINPEDVSLKGFEDVEFGDDVVLEPEDGNQDFIEEVEITTFVCPQCSAVYKTEKGLTKHITKKH